MAVTGMEMAFPDFIDILAHYREYEWNNASISNNSLWNFTDLRKACHLSVELHKPTDH